MRYADGGGLTMEGRSRRQQVRLQAAGMFEHGEDAGQIASSLRVSTKSVYQWRRAWQAGGEGALASRGAFGNPCKLDEEQIAELLAALRLRLTGGSRTSGGPWPGSPRWSCACSASPTRCANVAPAHLLGLQLQVPAHRAFERDEDAVAGLALGDRAKVRGSRR